MYEMNKLQVFQKKFRKTKELGKQKRSALGTPQLFQHL